MYEYKYVDLLSDCLLYTSQLALQGEAGEKDPVALFGELVVELLGQYAVRRPLTLPILLLVAQKDIKGCLLYTSRCV